MVYHLKELSKIAKVMLNRYSCYREIIDIQVIYIYTYHVLRYDNKRLNRKKEANGAHKCCSKSEHFHTVVHAISYVNVMVSHKTVRC